MNLLEKHTIIIQILSLVIGALIYIYSGTLETQNWTNLICFFFNNYFWYKSWGP